MNSLCRIEILAVVIAGLLFLLPVTAYAEGGAPCGEKLRNKLEIANTALYVCEISTQLVPGRTVVLALWSTTPDASPQIPLAAVFDLKALESGRMVYLYKRPTMGEALADFLFNGKRVDVAIADFDKSGRVGWAMTVLPDSDYSFDMTVYNPKTRRFEEVGPGHRSAGKNGELSFVVHDADLMVQVSKGKILIPICDASGGTPIHPVSDLYFEVYRLKNGYYEQGDRILATNAPVAERTKCSTSAN